MAKSVNDNMMTRLQLRGFLPPPHVPRLHTGMVWGRKSPVGSRDKAPIGDLDWDEVPKSLEASAPFLLILHKIFQTLSFQLTLAFFWFFCSLN